MRRSGSGHGLSHIYGKKNNRGAGPSGGGGGDDSGGNDDTTTIPLPVLPVDLPTAYYAALAARTNDDNDNDAPTTYINYPARIHHLKYPPATLPQPTSPIELSSPLRWEDLHLRQKVSSPRLHTRWTQPATAETTARAAAHFLQFQQPSLYGAQHPGGFLGFQPYADFLYLDAAYMDAAFAALDASGIAALEQGVGAEDAAPDFDVVVPFLSAEDRRKVRVLAVSAAALGEGEGGRRSTANRVLGLVGAFPELTGVMLVSVAAVERPASAAWDLETEFARWCGFMDVVRAERDSGEEGEVEKWGLVRGLLEHEGQEKETHAPLEVKVMEALRRAAVHDKRVGANALVMLYFRDAFERATDEGWEPGLDLVSVDHLDLGMA